ncbi:MAG: DUF1918 domain-containing protein [Candidatus Limnocylindrales bacterium]
MDAKIGDRIVVETERVGMPAREGEILQVIESPSGPHYRVRWDDGRESSFWPAAGSARIIPRGAVPGGAASGAGVEAAAKPERAVPAR